MAEVMHTALHTAMHTTQTLSSAIPLTADQNDTGIGGMDHKAEAKRGRV